MKPAADIMKEKIDKTNFKEPKYPIVNNVNALPETDPVKIKIYYTNKYFQQLDGEKLLLIYQKMVYQILLK